MFIMEKLSHFVISWLLLKIFTRNSEYVFTVQRAIHTIKGDNSKCIFFSELCPLLDLEKTLTYCNISVINEDIYLKLGAYVHYPRSNLYNQGRQFKMHLFQNCAPFST